MTKEGGPALSDRPSLTSLVTPRGQKVLRVLLAAEELVVTLAAVADVGPPASVRAVKFFYVNTEDGPLQRIEVPRVAEAAATTPDVVTRAEWGADESLKHISGDCKRDFAPLQQIFVHHTAAEPKGQDYDAAMRAIYWYHVKGRGWCDIGYNFVVAPNGRLFEGRWARDYAPFELHSSENLDGEAVVGAQVEGFNTGSIGVSLMGNYMNHSMTTAMRSSLVDFLAWEADRHNLDPTGSHVYRNPETGVHAWLPYIAGHRDAGKTSCPGDYVYRSLWALRKSVAQVIAAGKRATKLTLSGSTGTVPVGQPVTFKGRLVDEKGAALAGRQVKLYRRAGGQWSLVRKVTTGGAGGFSATFEPRRRFTLRAYYPGGDHLWSSVSHDFRVVVSHFVSLKLDGGPGRWDGQAPLSRGHQEHPHARFLRAASRRRLESEDLPCACGRHQDEDRQGRCAGEAGSHLLVRLRGAGGRDVRGRHLVPKGL